MRLGPNGRSVRVVCPDNLRPGQALQITPPPEPPVITTSSTRLHPAELTAAHGATGGGGARSMTQAVRRLNDTAAAAGHALETHLVTVPPDIFPGMSFVATIEGDRVRVRCPASAGPNTEVRIVKPTVPVVQVPPTTEVFEVQVPPEAVPGRPFALRVNGQRVLVQCPPNVVPGQMVRFELPVSSMQQRHHQLEYEQKHGWRRTLRSVDLKYQWVRLDENNLSVTEDNYGSKKKKSSSCPPEPAEFDFTRAAYVRQITFLEGNDARLRTGTVELRPASEAVVDSHLVVRDQLIVSYGDISNVQGKPLKERKEWLDDICRSKLQGPWEDGHVKIRVRRGPHLLLDSKNAVLALSREDMRQWWLVEFLEEGPNNDTEEFLVEPAIDAGGPTKEWFELVAKQIFDPAFGLFVTSTHNQACVEINPGSAVSCPDDHLIFFRFVGRFIGRALFNGRLIKTGHLAKVVYKHLLGWPISIEDIRDEGEEYYKSLMQLTTLDDVSVLALDFTTTEEGLGIRHNVPLVENGAEILVTNENVSEYLEATLRYRLFQRTKPQLTEILLGFFDIIPEPLLTVFDASELELILCGMPDINVDDWQLNTNYDGLFETRKENHPVVQWFWEVVCDEFDHEMRARLLQFATATSSVPLGGFACLLDIHGDICNFTVRGVDSRDALPRASTCLNRIYLPTYESKEILCEKLKIAVLNAGTGFGYE